MQTMNMEVAKDTKQQALLHWNSMKRQYIVTVN